ncbi:MAG: effector binding domain-containing protein [Legionella sp.]|nr:effector binding domain-containing protein [Legionella sp.]
MQKEKLNLGQLNLIGLKIRTNNRDEMNPETSKIAMLAGQYWGEQVANAFKGRIHPGVTYAAYTEYDSDEHGEYTYFIGEAVDGGEAQDLSQFKSLIIPQSTYQKFTTESGQMPDIVIASWQDIWGMGEADFEGKRSYVADFEVYDERAHNPNQMALDIYIGINNKHS